jgi:hypothetical protein
MARHIVTFDDIVACARRTGVPVVKAPSSHRGRVGEMGTVVGLTLHWTGTKASFRPTDDYPDYNVVKEGRAGLNNSLSADGLGRFRNIYVFSEDLSYHAGVWNWQGITDGNGHFLGTEAAGDGQWTSFQLRVYPRLTASKLLFLDAPITMAPTHAQGAMPRGRKSDFPASSKVWAPDLPGGPRSFHDAVSWLMANPNYINVNYTGDEDIVDDATMDKIADKVVAKLLRSDVKPTEGTQSLGNVLSQIHTALTEPVDPNSPGVTGGPEDGAEVKPVSRAKMIEYVEARSRRQARDMATLLDRLPEPPA